MPDVRAIYYARYGARRGVGTEQNHRLLEQACAVADVDLGAYDHHILLWLAGFEPHVCAVIAGWVTRAAAGKVADPGTLATLSAPDQ